MTVPPRLEPAGFIVLLDVLINGYLFNKNVQVLNRDACQGSEGFSNGGYTVHYQSRTLGAAIYSSLYGGDWRGARGANEDDFS